MLRMTFKGDFSPGFKGNLRCQRVPQGSEALYGGSRCSSALLFLLCLSSDHGRASTWDRKYCVYVQALAFFLRVPIIMVFFVRWAHIHYELACTHQLISHRPQNTHQMVTIPVRVQRKGNLDCYRQNIEFRIICSAII